MGKAVSHQVNVSVQDSWETPPIVLEDAMKKYNIQPIIDVCATSTNHKFNPYFTSKDNALIQDWREDFFMNPPYSEITQWMQKAYEQHKKWNVNALILVFAKTGVNWWHQYVEGRAEVHFQHGRIRFLLNGVEPRYCTKCKIRFAKKISNCENCKGRIGKSSPTYDSAWIIYRKK